MKERYETVAVPALNEQFSYDNVMQVPRVLKVIVNMGVGEAIQDTKTLDHAVREMAMITGQKPLVTRAKKSIAAFKQRAGMPIGCKVTIRSARMWEFLDRLFSVALPRIRDFRGLPPKSLDGRGNYTLGLRDQTIFPEIEIDSIDRVRGMDITIVTSARTDEEARALLIQLGLPLRKS
ncbi:MAG: 50S ribosomal protein L5 [Armatimonadota bacterium]